MSGSAIVNPHRYFFGKYLARVDTLFFITYNIAINFRDDLGGTGSPEHISPPHVSIQNGSDPKNRGRALDGSFRALTGVTNGGAFVTHSSEYIGLALTIVISAGIAGLMMLLHVLLGPKNKSTSSKSEPFECGVRPFESPRGQLSVKFYLVAMLFILFDVEVVWFFPWAVNLRELGWTGIGEMFAFIALLALGFAYAWKKGALEWEK